MAHPLLTASDLQLFGADANDSDARTARAGSPTSASKTFSRWFVGTFALAMTGLTFAVLLVTSAPPA